MGYGDAPLKKILKSEKNIIHFPYQSEIEILRLMSESSSLVVTIFHEITGHAIFRLCTYGNRYDISFRLNIKNILNVNKKKINLKIEEDIFSRFFFFVMLINSSDSI